MSYSSQWSAVQGAAVMILLRLFRFFCADAPYSAAHAKGMALAAAMQCVLLLPLLHCRGRLQLPRAALWILRIYAIFYAAVLTGALFSLCVQMRLRRDAAAVLLALTLLYTVPLHDRATARTATLLLCAAAGGFLLLPVSGIGTAQRILLHTPDSAPAAFFREWQAAGELPLLPLIWQKQTAQGAARSTAAWALFRCIFLPALVLFGAMQNGRLLQFAGNPFFLLLARTPLSDAVRTDGFWLLLAFSAGALCMTFCLQTGKPHLPQPARAAAASLLPYLFALAVLCLCPPDAALSGLMTMLCGILLPWCIVAYHALQGRRNAA